jgi:hypothetical protein
MQTGTNMVRAISLFILSPQMVVSAAMHGPAVNPAKEKLLIVGFHSITRFYYLVPF